MEFLRLNTEEDRKKINIETNIRLLDHASMFEGGLLGRCVKKNDGLYTFVATSGFQFLGDVKELEGFYEQNLKENEGYIHNGAWFFDGASEGVSRLVAKEDSLFANYQAIYKEISDYMRKLNPAEVRQFLFDRK